MARTIKNMKDLEKALQPVLLGMVDELSERVYQTLNYFLLDYYSGYAPSSYRRTRDFLYSAVKVKAKMTGNRAVASVYIDVDAMDNYYNATGFQVASWANQGLHGGMETGHKPHVWDDTLNESINSGELLKLAVDYLRGKGISVTNF